MRGAALAALAEADVIAYLVEATEMDPPTLEAAAELDAPPRAPVLTVCNKIDALNPRALKRRTRRATRTTSSSPPAPAKGSPS